MKRTDKYSRRVVFEGEPGAGERLTVRYTNRGEPYTQGAEFAFEDMESDVAVYLERRELAALHKMLGELLGDMKR